MEHRHKKSISSVQTNPSSTWTGGESYHSRERSESHSSTTKSKSKEGKPRWLSQIKDWVVVSEPSTQALKQHKKDVYKRAGISMDDPQANVKLHIPVAPLPPEAIKPAGPGPDPEEIALKRAEERRRSRQSCGEASGPSRGSYSSHSADGHGMQEF